MAKYASDKDLEMTKAPMSHSDVDTAYAGNPEAALKLPEAVSRFVYICTALTFMVLYMHPPVVNWVGQGTMNTAYLNFALAALATYAS